MNVIIKVGVDSENVSLTSEGLPILARLRAVYPMFLLSQLTDDFKVKKRTTLCVCVCVCVCVFSSHSFWTSSSLDVPAGVTQEEGHT